MTVPNRRLPGAAALARLRSQPLAWHLVLGVLAAAALYFVTSSLSPYDNSIVAEITPYAIAIAGLSLLTGVSGQISLGHGAFMAIGAYGAGLMIEHFHLPLIVPILVGVGAGAALGAIIGLPATRLRGPYLAGVTLAIALAAQDIPNKFSSFFRGDAGILLNPPRPPSGVNPDRWLAWMALAGAIVAMIVLGNFMKSRYGRALKAVRDDEVAAEACGLSPARLRVLAFALSAGAAGLAGALFALWEGVVSPNSFSLVLSIQLLAGMVIGGSGTLFGAWWGALAVVYVPQWTSSIATHISSTSGVVANLQDAVFGVLIIVIMMVAPSGIQGWLRSGYRRLRRRGSPPDLGPVLRPGLDGLTASITTQAPERTSP